MSQKLDDFNKILIATGTINYMASALEGVIKDYKHLISVKNKSNLLEEDTVGILEEGLEKQKYMMAYTRSKLCEVIEYLGNFLDGHDIICPLDQRVYEVPLNILLHGMDEEETNYEEETVK